MTITRRPQRLPKRIITNVSSGIKFPQPGSSLVFLAGVVLCHLPKWLTLYLVDLSCGTYNFNQLRAHYVCLLNYYTRGDNGD